jgi:glycosyltransferase involved in cell wall biosynthesis
MADPLVSVLIPCYNAERWIRATVDSVLRQTWKNLQIVIVNDGSTDRSEEHLREYARAGVTVVDQENRGQTAALNRCLAEARGEFVQYLDADDVLDGEKIERQMGRLMHATDCIATSEWARFYDDVSSARFEADENWRDMDPVDWLVSAWRDGGGMLFPAQWLMPKAIVDRVGPWREDLTLNNDAEYFTRAVLASKRVLFCEGARAYYRSGIHGSLSGMRSKSGWISQKHVLEACQSYLLAREDSPRTRRAASLLWQRFAHASYPHDREIANDAERRGHALDSVRVDPGGGRALRFLIRILGWKTGRVLQTWYYRIRHGRA